MEPARKEVVFTIRCRVDNQGALLNVDTTKVLPEKWREKRVLCIPGVGQLDEAVALIVADVLRKRGLGVRAEQAEALSISRIFTLETKDVSAICVCFIESASAAQIGYAVRRLRRKVPEAFIVIGLLGRHGLAAETAHLRQVSKADAIETTLEGVRECLVGQAKQALSTPSPERKSVGPLTLARN